jgi:hypothetical protein
MAVLIGGFVHVDSGIRPNRLAMLRFIVAAVGWIHTSLQAWSLDWAPPQLLWALAAPWRCSARWISPPPPWSFWALIEHHRWCFERPLLHGDLQHQNIGGKVSLQPRSSSSLPVRDNLREFPLVLCSLYLYCITTANSVAWPKVIDLWCLQIQKQLADISVYVYRPCPASDLRINQTKIPRLFQIS